MSNPFNIIQVSPWTKPKAQSLPESHPPQNSHKLLPPPIVEYHTISQTIPASTTEPLERGPANKSRVNPESLRMIPPYQAIPISRKQQPSGGDQETCNRVTEE